MRSLYMALEYNHEEIIISFHNVIFFKLNMFILMKTIGQYNGVLGLRNGALT